MARLLMGIDLGTSSLKTLVVDETGARRALSACSYQYDSPCAGYAEQDPEVWWRACVRTVRAALSENGLRAEDIAGISFSGQMHGAVLLDAAGEVIRPAILHCDARSAAQVEAVNRALGPEQVRELMLNPVYTGFLLTSLLWVRDNEPENFEKIRWACLPKDYIKYKLTGEVSTDLSDGSATLAFDLLRPGWSAEILRRFDLPAEIFPPCFDTCAPAGWVCAAAVRETGLAPGTLVAAGGGDQIMQGIGNGVTDTRTATANIGSSGQVCYQSDTPVVNPALSTNTFCGYRRGRWIVMGAIMHAGLSLSWFNSLFDSTDYAALDALADRVPPGSGGLVFLPYLNGERTPHVNPNLSGMFLGCNIHTGRPEMARAVMEGVCFALRQCMEVCGGMGLTADRVVASGGGARSPLWLQMQSDVYGLPLLVTDGEEQACLGAAIVAGVCAGVFRSVEEACGAVVRYRPDVVEPDQARHHIYNAYYDLFKQAYTANSTLLERITRMGRGERPL